jgi:hypothetical protein
MDAESQSAVSATTLPLSQWRPRPRLVVRETPVEAPAFPVIDVHNHVGRWLSPTSEWMAPDVSGLLALLERARVETLVNLDGKWGDELELNLARYDVAHPGRFTTFCHLDWSLLLDSDSNSRAADGLATHVEKAFEAGARGVKIWKDLGLSVRDGSGSVILPDDPRVVEAVQAAGELGLPVLIHTADPVAFFDPLDSENERIDELTEMPEWWFGGPGHRSFEELYDALGRLVAACPETVFVGAHVGCLAEDLDRVGGMLAACANWHVDTGGRLAEVGRQPRAFRRLVEAFPSRVLFGSDCFPPDLGEYRRWWRFLETDDEHFAYHDEDSTPPQGRWRISGAALPRTLLRAVYLDNAQRVLKL